MKEHTRMLQIYDELTENFLRTPQSLTYRKLTPDNSPKSTYRKLTPDDSPKSISNRIFTMPIEQMPVGEATRTKG